MRYKIPILFNLLIFCTLLKGQGDTEIKNRDFDSLIENCKKVAFYNSDSAIKIYKIAIRLARVQGDSNKVSIAQNSRALIEILNGNLKIAEKYCNKAILNVDTINDPLTVANIHNSFAKIYKDQQLYQKSLNQYFISLDIRERHKDTLGQAGSLINIGGLYSAFNNVELSLKYYLKAFELIKDKNELQTFGALNNNIAIAYKKLSNNSLAIKHYRFALNIFKELKYTKAEANILSNIGVLYEDINPDSTLFYYNKSLDIHEQIKNNYGIALTKINIGIIYYLKKRYKRAETLYFESIIIAKQIDSKRLLEYAYGGLKDIYLATDDFKNALKYSTKYRTITDSLYSVEVKKQIAELETKYQTAQKEREIETLQKDNEIQQLQLKENEQRTKAQRRLFLALAFILLSVIIVIWFVYKNYKKQQTINQQKLLYQKILTEQKMLRSQMNPHFFYNSLNSIQAYISLKKTYEAEKYLAQFGKLFREILENSRVELITLEKEIEVLDLYLNLEQLRFENRFSFEIKTDDNIETDFINIPPMIVQPFVENSIIHGFKNQTNKKLTINFTENNDSLICEIDDNGVGRKAAGDLAEDKKHNSLATTITNERLQIITDEYNKPASIEIIDKVDPETNKALGTKVIIIVPLID